jgi:hypothetical protein
MALSNENNPISVVVAQGNVTANQETGVFYLPKKSKIVSLHLMDSVGIAANDTDYITVSLKKGSTVVASYDSRAANQGALTALVAKAAAIVSGQEEQDADSSLSLDIVLEGAAVITAGSMVLTYYPL